MTTKNKQNNADVPNPIRTNYDYGEEGYNYLDKVRNRLKKRKKKKRDKGASMISELIKIANNLDSKGLMSEADDLDKILQSILQMIEDKSIDTKETGASDGLAFDLFIDNKGRAVGAEPASGGLGSTCIMNEEAGGEDDVIAEYDVTSVDEGDKESGEEEICVVDVEDSCAMQMTDAILGELDDTLEEWEEKEYKSDEARYKTYYKDIEDIVEEFSY